MIPPWAKNQLDSFEFFYQKSGAAMKLNSATIPQCLRKHSYNSKKGSSVLDYESTRTSELI